MKWLDSDHSPYNEPQSLSENFQWAFSVSHIYTPMNKEKAKNYQVTKESLYHERWSPKYRNNNVKSKRNLRVKPLIINIFREIWDCIAYIKQNKIAIKRHISVTSKSFWKLKNRIDKIENLINKVKDKVEEISQRVEQKAKRWKLEK